MMRGFLCMPTSAVFIYLQKTQAIVAMRSVISTTLFLTFMLPCAVAAREHKSWDGCAAEMNLWYSKMIRHTSRFTGPLSRQSYVAELNIIKQTYGQKDWHIRRNYPVVGLGFIYINYNVPNVYGQVFGVFPNVQLRLIKGEKLEWTLRAGMGLGYVTKPFSRFPKANTENVAIGGHLNNVSPFTTDIRYKASEHWQFHAGLNFVHVSNAAFRQPNLGINMWGCHIGARYFPVGANPAKEKRALPRLHNRVLFQIRGALAFAESRPAGGPLYANYIGTAYASLRYSGKNKLLLGADYTYQSSTYAYLKNYEIKVTNYAGQSSQAAVFIGNEFLLGRIGVMFQLGYYVKKMYEQTQSVYQKLGGNLYIVQKETGFLKELYASVLLKTHTTTADFCEIGIGAGF